jgi:predicted PurR-regulated permease PerM
MKNGLRQNGSRASVWFLLALLVGFLMLGFLVFRFFLQPIAFATIIGIGFHPLHVALTRLIGGRNRSALLTTFIVILIFVLPVLLLVSAAGGELIKAARHLSDRSSEEGGPIAYLSHKQDKILGWLGKYLDIQELRLEDALANLPRQVSRALLTAGRALVGGLAGFAGNAILTFLILFFVFRDGQVAVENVTSVLPLTQEQAQRLVLRIHDSIVANLYGILAVGLAQGVLTGMGLAILGVGSALLLGLAAAFCSLIPLLGTMLVWLPTAIYLMATGHLWKGIIMLLWGALIVGLVDNIVRPLILSGKVKLHPVILLFALLGGVQVFGVIGIFIGPLVVSMIAALIGMLREERTLASRDVSPDVAPAV